MNQKNYYEILELSLGCSLSDIKKAFRSLSKIYHPDVNPSPGASHKFIEIQTAYTILKDTNLRKTYDSNLCAQTTEWVNIQLVKDIEIILAWSTTYPSFDPSFAFSCLNQLMEGKELSARQVSALNKILNAFKIDIDKWDDDELRLNTINKAFPKEYKQQ
jgi:DnaJ-class molecular chaperone|tara:strand:+ start:988 stop:1467 length:480 start_codon:yes stop_codon:yes gene_type:complete